MMRWKKTTWIGRGRSPDDDRAEAYDELVLRLSSANPPMLEASVVDDVLMSFIEEGESPTGGEILSRCLAWETCHP